MPCLRICRKITRLYNFRKSSTRFVVTVYSKGTGVFGALGHGDLYDSYKFCKVDLDDNIVHRIATGWGHSALATTKGLLIVGRPYDFISLLRINRLHKTFFPILGRIASGITAWFGDKGGLYVDPRWFSNLNISNVSSSAGLTVFITSDGLAYAFGGNRWGQCGVDSEKHLHIFSPTQIGLPSPVQLVDTGLQHVIVLACDGKVYTWGKGERGQLGNGERENHHNSIHIPFDKKAVHVSAGFSHSAVILEDGSLFVWGKGLSTITKEKNSGRLRLFEDQLVPRHVAIPGNRKAVQVVSSNFNMVIVAEDNSLWALGLGEHDRNMNSVPLPVRLYDTDWNRSSSGGSSTSSESEGNSCLTACAIDTTVRLQKGYKRVLVFDTTSTVCDPHRAMKRFATATTDTEAYNKCASIAFEVVLHEDEAFLQPVELPGLPAGGRLLDLSVGWQHTLALVEEGGD